MKKILIVIALLYLTSCSEENPITPITPHYEPDGMWISETSNPNDTTFYYVNDRNNPFPTGDSVFNIQLNTVTHYTVYFLDSNRNLMAYPQEPDKWLSWVINSGDSTKISIYKNNPSDWAFNLRGNVVSTAYMRLQVMHIDHADFITPYISVHVSN